MFLKNSARFNYTEQQKFAHSMKLTNLYYIWVAESESGIGFFPARQNLAVLPISWLPGTKITFSRFVKKPKEIWKI